MYSRIAGTGKYLPERILTNADLEKMVDTSDEWIRSRSGIETRHIAAARKSLVGAIDGDGKGEKPKERSLYL